MDNKETLNKLEESLLKLKSKENKIFFLTYDTKGNARASVKHIYDIALTLKNDGYDTKILVEDNTYEGVNSWLGDKYESIEIINIKENKAEINIEDIIVVPEYYSNVLQQLVNVKANKIMLIQQKDYIFENLPVGSKWINYGFDKAITTSDTTKRYIQTYFPETLTYTIPPFIGDNFKPSDTPQKPFIAINCRDRVVHRKLISEFYLKYPQLRWITFRDMVQMSYDEFSNSLKECFVSLWVDNESTFGTFPLESMKCGIPVVGKIPEIEPEWLSENGFWTYETNKLVDILGSYILSWLEGIEINDEVKDKMKDTVNNFTSTDENNNIVSIFQSINNKREELIMKTIKKLNNEEV